MRGDRVFIQASTFERRSGMTPLDLAELVREQLGPDPFNGEGEIVHWIEGANHVFGWRRKP